MTRPARPPIPPAISAVVLTLLGLGASGSPPLTRSRISLPVVSGAEVPFYPRIAVQAGAHGTVRLQVSTDGNGITQVKVVSGPPLFIQAATDNIKTWRVEPHEPTTFEAVFEYELLDEASCALENGIAVLELPTKIEIRAKRLSTCDPGALIDPPGTDHK